MALDKTASMVTRINSITASDSANCRTGLLYVGVTGNVKLDTIDGDTVTLIGVAAGVVHPILVKKIYATGTTATNIFTCN